MRLKVALMVMVGILAVFVLSPAIRCEAAMPCCDGGNTSCYGCVITQPKIGHDQSVLIDQLVLSEAPLSSILLILKTVSLAPSPFVNFTSPSVLKTIRLLC